MSSELSESFVTPVIVTSFRDFELEERVVRILAHRGFQIGERKIVGTRELSSDEILITDIEVHSTDLPIISIPWQAREWDDATLQGFIRDQIYPPFATATSWPSVLVIAQGEWCVDPGPRCDGIAKEGKSAPDQGCDHS